MLICAYILSICGLIFCTVPILGLIIAVIGLILFLIIKKNNKFTTNKIFITLGLIFSTIVVILCIIYNLVVPLRTLIENGNVVNKAKVSVIGAQRLEIEERINLYYMLNKVTDKSKYIKEKLILSKVKNDEIIYNSSSVEKINDNSIKQKIALKNSKTTYYKINSKNIKDLSPSINIDNFVIDLQGNVYINVNLDKNV